MKTRIIGIIIILGVLISLITGCFREAHSSVKEMMEVLPDDIFAFMSIDLEALRADDDLEDIYDSMWGSEDELSEELGIYPSEINTIAVAYSYDYDMWGFIKGDYYIDEILDTFEDKGYGHDEYRGVEIWSADYEVFAFLGNMLVTAGSEDSLRASIRISTGEGTSMYSNEDYRDVLNRLPAGIITMLMQEEYEEYLAAGFTMRKSTGTNDTMEINGCFKFSSEQEAKNNIQQMEDDLESGDAYNINLNQKGEFIEITWEIDMADFDIPSF